MNPAYRELLQKRIDGLDEKEYDLEVWKNGTALLLTRVFGEGNSYTKEIDALKVDYSSWSLRDATSDYNPRETCKKLGREILDLAMAELQLSTQDKNSIEIVKGILKDQSGKFEQAIARNDENAVVDLLKNKKKDVLAGLLAKLLVK